MIFGATYQHSRSAVPDLIYSDYRQERIEEVCAHWAEALDTLPPQWRRLTLFVTYRCSLDCVYCKTIYRNPERDYPAKDQEYDFIRFRRLFDHLSSRPLRHIHFTGGEATLVRDLPLMVELASHHGTLCSTTSNGMSNPEVYERLVDAGISEIRVSFDSHVPEEFDRIVRRSGAYRHVIDNVEKLVRLRERHSGTPFVILNVCVGMKTRCQLNELIKTALALGPNDIKLIPIVQDKNELADFSERDKVVAGIEKTLSHFPSDAFPLLRQKLHSLFSPESIGLKDLASRQLMKHCVIPLTERTLDTTYYYPCSVYLRESGKPLGRLDEDSLELQQKKIADFVAGSSCRDDPICREYCIGCCRQFNLAANAALRGTVWEADGTERPIDYETTIEREPSFAEIIGLRKAIERCNSSLLIDEKPAPYLVIKPSGLNLKNHILEALRREGLRVVKEIKILDWNRSAAVIYCSSIKEASLRRSLILAAALPRLETSRSAHMVILERNASLSALQRVKEHIRKYFSPKYALIHSSNDIFVTALNHVHVPEPNQWELEFRLLMAYIESETREEMVEL